MALAATFSHETSGQEASGARAPQSRDQASARAFRDVARAVTDRTNQLREEEGLPPVDGNRALTGAAEYFAGYMARTDRYGHTADGNRPADRAEEFGYDYCLVLENIAWQYSSQRLPAEELADRFFEGWVESAEHLDNMLDPDVTQIGMAVAQDEITGRYYAVQMFGRPRSQRIEFTVANRSDATIEYRVNGRDFTIEPRYTRTHSSCRPPKLDIALPGEERTENGGNPTGGVQRPRDGRRYTVRGDAAQGYTIQTARPSTTEPPR